MIKCHDIAISHLGCGQIARCPVCQSLGAARIQVLPKRPASPSTRPSPPSWVPTAPASPTSPTPSAGSWGSRPPRTCGAAKMEDVIFGGTQKRKPRWAYAEVTLVLDNTRGRLPHLEETEVMVTRPLLPQRGQRILHQPASSVPAAGHSRAVHGHRLGAGGVFHHRAGQD